MVRVRASRRSSLVVKLAFTSPLQLKISQQYSQQQRCVVCFNHRDNITARFHLIRVDAGPRAPKFARTHARNTPAQVVWEIHHMIFVLLPCSAVNVSSLTGVPFLYQ
jgi:hypothetical protein